MVLSALTEQAQKTFCILLSHQLSNPQLTGMPFEDLFKATKTAFYATSERALKQHVNEFESHALVRQRSGAGGKLCYACTLPKDTMQSILDNRGAAP